MAERPYRKATSCMVQPPMSGVLWNRMRTTTKSITEITALAATSRTNEARYCMCDRACAPISLK
jgi:hypothetical protein